MTKVSGEDHRPKRTNHQRPERNSAPREPRPIDAAQLQELALGYAARYATTAAKLRQYLVRKLRDRVWTPADPPDLDALVRRIVTLGYVDDRAYATAKQRDLTTRGYGVGRVRQALAAAGVSREDVGSVIAPPDGAPDDPFGPAIAFARPPERLRRELAAMARAGHGFDVARRVLMATDEAAALQLAQD